MTADAAMSLFVALAGVSLSACGARGGGAPGAGGASSLDAAADAGDDGRAAPCVGNCTPDPGSRPVNCAQQEAGLEFLKVWDFESRFGDGMYEYTDRSTANISPNAYGPPSVQTDRCGPTRVMHIVGGPFRGWGGGVGVGFNNVGTSVASSGELSRARCDSGPVEGKPDYCPAPRAEYPELTLDLSKWDGVSLWARRGPNSQAALRVGLGDRQTDEDVSFKSQYRAPGAPVETPPRKKYCRRNRECGCANLRPCTPLKSDDPASLRYCWDPARDPNPMTTDDPRLGTTETCGQTRCAEPYIAYAMLRDPEFQDKACTPHAFSNGMASSYCFNESVDPAPADSNEICGDHWVFPVSLGTDWRLYFIPFTELQQQGFGKKFSRIDLTAVSMLRLMWDVGWIDYWVDDVGFYRVRK